MVWGFLVTRYRRTGEGNTLDHDQTNTFHAVFQIIRVKCDQPWRQISMTRLMDEPERRLCSPETSGPCVGQQRASREIFVMASPRAKSKIEAAFTPAE